MNANTNTEDTIDLKELFFSLLSEWKLIALSIILSLVCALLYLRVTPDTYAVNALVQVEDSKGAASAALLGNLSSMVDQKSPAQAEIEILKSRLVLGAVIKDLHLDVQVSSTEDSFFKRLLNKAKFETDYTKQSILFKDNHKQFEIRQFEIPSDYLDKNLLLSFNQSTFKLTDTDTDEVVLTAPINQSNYLASSSGVWKVSIFTRDSITSSYNVIKMSLPAAVDNLNSNYSVSEKGKLTGILGLSYQGHDKEHITHVLNTILKAYSAQNIERRTAESAQTLKFLDEQLPELKQQLDNAEREFNKFRQQYNTVDVNKESELYLTQSITLETKKAELEQQQAEMAAKYTADHPSMREINSQLDAITKQISSLNSTLKQLPDLQRQYLQLYREVEVKTQLYTTLLNSYQQLRIAKAGEIGNVRIVDTAVNPVEPIKPKKLIVLVLAMLIGGFIGAVAALARHMLQSGIKDSTQIESEFDLPVYATVPRSPVQETRVNILKKKKSIPILAVKHSDDIAIESLRSIRTAIHFALANARNNIITITGPAPEIGKSFISTNLATIFAQSGKKVLLIDADLRRGYIHKYFNLEVKPGLSDVIRRSTSLDSVIHQTNVEHLHMITRGESPASPSELLSTSYFSELLEQLRPLYDHIIIDTPPVLAVTDGIIISQYSGVNLVVARYAKTQVKELELTLNRFEQANVKVNGFILNDIQQTVGTGYGYAYAYAYKANNKDD